MPFLLLALFSVMAFAQTSAQLELEVAVFNKKQVSVLIFDAIVDQNLQDMDDRDLERLKVTILEGIFGDGNVQLTTSFLSLQHDSYRIEKDQKFSVNQLQLMSGTISSVTPLSKGFKLTLTAHAGVGVGIKGYLDATNNKMLNDAESLLLKKARECSECVKEAIKQFSYFPLEAGVKIQLNKDLSYISLSGDYQKSGKLNTIPGEDRLPVNVDRYKIHVDENKTVIPLRVEVGQGFKNTPITIFARGERIDYKSTVDTSTQGYLFPYEEKKTTNYTLKVGLKIKFGRPR